MIIFDQLGEPMKKRTRPTFSPEFRLQASQLVVDQNYTVRAAAQAMNAGILTMANCAMLWARSLASCYRLLKWTKNNVMMIDAYGVG
jgi:hypothetical protein